MIDEVRCLYNLNVVIILLLTAGSFYLEQQITNFKTTNYWYTKYSVCIQDAAEQKQAA